MNFSISGSLNIKNLKDKVKVFSKAETFQRIAANLVFKVSSYFAEGAQNRHKWANKLGAQPTGMLEFRPSRGVSTSRTGALIYSTSDIGSASAVIEGVMGIERAFKDLDIYPVRASALTVPINKASYAKTVGDLIGEGWHVFRRGRTLVGNHGKQIGGRAVPLFALCGHVHVKKDEGLLPSSDLVYNWAIDEAVREIDGVS